MLVSISSVLGILLSAQPLKADFPCIGPSCKFTITGAKGPFIKQVDPKTLETAGAALKASAGETKGLAEHSINKGALAGSGLQMPATTTALTAVVERLRKSWPFPDHAPPQITLHMIGSTSYAPFAKPDNSIVVPLGFLIQAKTDDEIAWVLGHEVSHILLSHYAHSAEIERRKRMLEQVLHLAQEAFALSQMRAQATGQGAAETIHFYNVNDPAMQARSGMAWSYNTQLRTILDLRDSSATRTQEDEADAMGFDLALTSGYDVEDGASQALTTVGNDDALAAKSAQTAESQIQGLLAQSVHPAALNSLMSGNVKGALFDLGKTAGANLIRAGIDKGIAYMSQTHRDATLRREGLVRYQQAAYKALEDRQPSTAWLDAVRRSPEYLEAKAAVEAHDTALNDIGAGEAKKALADLEPALKTRYAHTPLIADEEAKIHEALGEIDVADRYYDLAEGHGPKAAVVPAPRVAATTAAKPRKSRKGGAPAVLTSNASSSATAVESPSTAVFDRQSAEGYQDHVDLLASHGNYAKAALVIHEAEIALLDHDFFLPQLIFIDLKTGKIDDMIKHMNECADLEDEALRTRCRYATLDYDQREKIKSLSPADAHRIDIAMQRNFDHARGGAMAPAGAPKP